MLPVILLVFLPACLAFSQCGGVSPGEMAHTLFLEADTDSNGDLALSEMLYLFEDYDQNGDGRITRAEYLKHVQTSEPELEQWYDRLYDVFDQDGDDRLDLHDYVGFYMDMDHDNDNAVSQPNFIGHWTLIYTAILDLHHEAC